MTEERTKKPVTSEEISQTANIVAGFIPGGPKDSTLRHLLTKGERVGKVEKIATKDEFVDFWNKKEIELTGKGLSAEDVKTLRDVAKGVEHKGIRTVNMELVWESLQKDAPIDLSKSEPDSVLDALRKLSAAVKEVSSHERGHTATKPIAKYSYDLFSFPSDELDDAALITKGKLESLMKEIVYDKRAMSVTDTELAAMMKKVGVEIPGGIHEDLFESVNNLWTVYNTRYGRKVMGKYITGRVAMNYFDDLAMQSYRPIGAGGQEELKYLPNLLKVPPAGTKGAKELLSLAKKKSKDWTTHEKEHGFLSKSGKFIYADRIHAKMAGDLQKTLTGKELSPQQDYEMVIKLLKDREWVRVIESMGELGFEVSQIGRIQQKNMFKFLKANPRPDDAAIYIDVINSGKIFIGSYGKIIKYGVEKGVREIP